MEFTHPSNQGLTSFLVGADLEGRIFFGEASESHTHFFLIGFGFGLDGERNNWLGKSNTFEDNRMLWDTEGITCSGIFHTYHTHDLTSLSKRYFLAVIGVHKYEASHSLGLVASGVVDIGATSDSAGVDT